MPMTPDEIKKALRSRGSNMSEIGRRLRPKITPTQVRRVVAGIDTSPRVRAAIAIAIGRDEREIWSPKIHTPHAA